MAQTFEFQARGRYYKRRTAKVIPAYMGEDAERGVSMVTPEAHPGMITRWGYQGSRYRRPHDVYVVAGQVCEIHNMTVELDPEGKPSKYAHCWTATRDRWVNDRHRDQTREQGREVLSLHVVNGQIVAALDESGRNVIEGMGSDEVMAYLDLI